MNWTEGRGLLRELKGLCFICKEALTYQEQHRTINESTALKDKGKEGGRVRPMSLYVDGQETWKIDFAY